MGSHGIRRRVFRLSSTSTSLFMSCDSTTSDRAMAQLVGSSASTLRPCWTCSKRYVGNGFRLKWAIPYMRMDDHHLHDFFPHTHMLNVWYIYLHDPRLYRSKGSSPGKKCLKSFGPQPFGIDFQRVQPNGFKPTTKLQFPGQTN